MEITVEGKGPGVYGDCAANGVLEWNGEEYPAEKRRLDCPDSKMLVTFLVHFAYASVCLC